MFRRLVALAVLMISAIPIAVQAQAQLSQTASNRVVRLLESTGFRYAKASAAAWTVSFNGTASRDVVVLVLASNTFVVVEGIVAQHDKLVNAAEAMHQLLKMNATASGATYLIDDDDDLIARDSFTLSTLDNSHFKSAVNAVALATDTAMTAIAQYVSSDSQAPSAQAYTMPSGATERADVLGGRASVAYNPVKWKETKSDLIGRRQFQHTNGDGYAMIISERVEIPLNQLRSIALSNARDAAPDAKVVEEDRRRVNGTDVMMLRLEGTARGIAFTYFGYYYAGKAGTVQVITYTGQNLFDEYRPDFQEFLNGFSAQP